MRRFLNQLKRSFSHLIYPSICLHCHQPLNLNEEVLCSSCFSLLELLDPNTHCPRCFSADYQDYCYTCQNNATVFKKMAAAFEYAGPAATLIKCMKYGGQPYLSKGCSAYLAAQFLNLNWPMPDLIVPVPIAFTHWIKRGFNQSLLLAEGMGKLLSVPVVELLSRKSGDYSQAGLSVSQRVNFVGELIALDRSKKFEGKMILLVDDVSTTGATLKRCGEVLATGFPKSIYALTFCQAMKLKVGGSKSNAFFGNNRSYSNPQSPSC